MFKALHEKALVCISNYKAAEKELLDILTEIDKSKAYLELGYSSLFNYATSYLGLSEGEAYRFSQVTRKSYLVPELKEAVGSGLLTVSKASRIAPVITATNQQEWIQKAIEMPQRALEQAVAIENPKVVRREFLKVVTPDLFELRLTLKKKTESDLKRAQEVFRTSNLEQTIEALLNFALSRKDPVAKAARKVQANSAPSGNTQDVQSNEVRIGNTQDAPSNRAKLGNDKGTAARGVLSPTLRQVGRSVVPASIRRQVFARDKGQCQYKSCRERRWTEIHHVRPLSYGGDHALENLVTLCSSHHRYLHEMGQRKTPAPGHDYAALGLAAPLPKRSDSI